MKQHLKLTVLACTLMQAFNVAAQNDIASVVVTANKAPSGERASVGGFADLPLVDTPASVSTFDAGLMQDLSIRSATEAARFDAAIGDAYNAIGYAEQFSVRGFALDNGNSYRKDMIAISGDTQIPLENKERIEILRGLAGLQAGVAAPGGMINYVTKRAPKTEIRSATVEWRERGTLYGALDIGGRFNDPRLGYRINAAAEKLKPMVRGADGKRQFISAALDWQITPDAQLALDIDHQHKEQLTAPGFQLIRNETLPTGISAKAMLNDQRWSRPVTTDSSNLGLRFDYRLNHDWRLVASANKHWFKRDDFAAFPYGCSNEGDGYYPGFCANGDYDLYDYQSTGERKTPWGMQAMLQGSANTGAVKHQLTLGASTSQRRDAYGEDVYDYVGYSNLWNRAQVAPAPKDRVTGPVMERLRVSERALFMQDVMELTPSLALHAGVRYVSLPMNVLDELDAGWVRRKDNFVLPNLAAVYSVARDWRVYASLAHGVQFGGIAPMETTNENTALAPGRSKQAELGIKGDLGQALSVSAALFEMRQGLEYTDATNTFVRAGQQKHRGVEFNANGRLNGSTRYSVSMMALEAKQHGTGEAATDGKRVTNVPKLRSSAWLEYTVPDMPQLKLDALWQYSGNKAFDPTNRVLVPSYHLLGVGASWAVRAGSQDVTLRARVDNVTNKFYWRDVTQSLGGYLLPGAPRSVRLSAEFNF